MQSENELNALVMIKSENKREKDKKIAFNLLKTQEQHQFEVNLVDFLISCNYIYFVLG